MHTMIVRTYVTLAYDVDSTYANRMYIRNSIVWETAYRMKHRKYIIRIVVGHTFTVHSFRMLIRQMLYHTIAF